MPTSEPTRDPAQERRRTLLLFAALFALLVAARLCHTDILWADEDYHQAAAMQALHGKVPYRDLWYDKPPLNVAVYLFFGAAGGAVLRIVSAIYALLICWSAFHFARRVWSRREGHVAASLAAFYLVFYFPSATITLEPDTLMILPQLWAVYFAWQRRPFAAGILAGIATLFNVKGLFVLAACVWVEWGGLGWLALGFLIPNAAGFGWLAAQGALVGYLEQVWRWGLLYAGSSSSVGTGLVRVVNWSAFHAALIIGTAWCWWKEPVYRVRWIGWTLISLAAAAVGWHFLPRYMDQLLPPLVLAASRGFVLAWNEKRRGLQVAFGLALVIPAVRFGPRYVTLAAETLQGRPHNWLDTAMDRESRAASEIILKAQQTGFDRRNSTLFVWGYRPNLFVYTRLLAASRFWDSQPLTGVPADRHLTDDRSSDPAWAAKNRAELVRSHPDFIADGLSLYNPRLDIHGYPELAAWLAQYVEVGRSGLTIVYRRVDDR